MRRFPSPVSRPDAWWQFGIVSVSLAIVAKQFAPTLADPDLWGHVLFGQLATAVGWIPRYDPYSYVSQAWTNHEWLSELIFGRLFGAAGSTGLVMLKLGTALTISGLLIWNLWDRGLELLRAAVLGLVLSIPLVVGLHTVRPHLFTYLFFTVTLLALLRAEGTDGRILLLLPPIFVAWTNLHGGVLAGLGVMGLWAGIRVVRSLYGQVRSRPVRQPAAWKWLAILAGVVAAMLVNPYGTGLLEFLLTTATVPRPDITEWQPISLHSNYGKIWLVGAALTTWVLISSKRKLSPEARSVLIVVVLLPLTAVRHLPLTFLGIAILGADAFAGLWERGGAPRGDAGQRERDRSPRAGWIGAGLTAFALVVLVRVGDDLECIDMSPDLGITYPVRATALIQESGVSADVASYFTYGEYLIWHLGPRVRVGMDGRRETVYSDSVYSDYLDFQHGQDDWSRFLDYGEPDLALVPVGIPADNLLELDPRWTVVFADTVARVYARRGSEAAVALAEATVPDLPATGRGLCFP